ncbi:MAG: YqeG family HAD IIIA-type phosphatase [Lachnospiraceae bacterium]|nr:YqeG family HAD IIIA-type phosphatase [Lachnospiraceae bacterium]
MFKAIYPDEYLDSTYEIDFEQLYDDGYRGIIFDIDNTLVPHGAPADERSKKLLNYLRDRGFKIVLLSNNSKARVDMFNEELHLDSIPMAAKPLLKNYKKAMEIMGTSKENTFFVGDQLFTDVWGAKRLGIRTILVKPINAKEEIQIVLKRKLENIVMKEYGENKKI